MSETTQIMYNELLHYGQIQPVLTQFEKELFDNSVNPLETVTDTELLSMAYQSKSALRREYVFPAYQPDENWKSGDTVELARMTIPIGFLGVLTRIDTVVIDATTGEAISTWGNPDSWDNIFRFAVTYNGASDKAVTDRRILIPAASEPADEFLRWIQGSLLFPLLTWTDDRYAWGNPSNDIGVVLPRQITVRLFIMCISDTGFRHKVKGRMVATTQLEKSISAAWRARRGSIR